jgi:type I restriction enzyme S subunit
MWSTTPLRRRYAVQLGKMLQPERRGGGDREIPFLQVGHIQWRGITTESLPTMWASPQDSERYELLPGDLLVCEGGDPGRAAVLKSPPADAIFQNHVFRVRALDARPLDFLAYVLRAIHGSGWLQALGNKVTLSGLAKQALVTLAIPDPPRNAQSRVVSFLDEEIGRLDATSAQLEQLVALVLDRKLRLISRLVSEGLSPQVARQDAGEDGLRRVPKHWTVKRLKWVAPRIQVGIVITPARYYVEQPGVPALRGSNIRPGVISNRDLVYLSEEGHLINRKSELHSGDVVVVRTGAAGAAAVVPDWADRFNAIDILIVRQDEAIRPRFLEFLVNSDFAMDQIARFSVGSLQAHFNVGALKQLLLALPPAEEQDAIVEYLNPRVAHLDHLLDRARADLALLAERRHAMLTAAVTGKLDEAKETLAA